VTLKRTGDILLCRKVEKQNVPCFCPADERSLRWSVCDWAYHMSGKEHFVEVQQCLANTLGDEDGVAAWERRKKRRSRCSSNRSNTWAPPTAQQIGLIGTHWSKGWIIENNTIRYSVCTGVTLGKYGDRHRLLWQEEERRN